MFLNKKKFYFLSKGLIFYYFLSQPSFYLNFGYFSDKFKFIFSPYFIFINFSILVLKVFNYYLFSILKRFIFFLKKSKCGFFSVLTLFGVGLFIEKCSSSLFKFSLVSSHFLYLFLPQDVVLKHSGSNFMIFGLTRTKVNNFSSVLLLLRAIGVYHLKGVSIYSNIIFLKEGKKR